MKTPLHTLKSELGSKSRNKDGFNFGMSLWETHAQRWWDDYLTALEKVNPRNRDRAEEAANRSAAEKLSRDEWVYLLLVDGFFEKEDLDSDIVTRAAVVNMRMNKPMSRTHEHDLFETRQFGASFNDLPNPRLVRVPDISHKLGAVDCWGDNRGGDAGRFRPLRTADAKLHPGWAVAGRHAARILFENQAKQGPEGARRAFDALRSFCSAMMESIAESSAVGRTASVSQEAMPLRHLLDQELSAASNASDVYVPEFYENVMTGFLLAAVHGAGAVYDYGLIQRRRNPNTVDSYETLMYDPKFQLNCVKSSKYVATVYLTDSNTLAPISLVRTVELDPSFNYAAGRAPSVPEGESSKAWRFLFLPGDDSVSRHTLSLEYDTHRGVWIATRPQNASRGWYFGGPAASTSDFSACRKGESVILKPGSRIVVRRISGLADSMEMPSIMVVFSYSYDLLDGGRWGRDAQVREFLSVDARDIWLPAFRGDRLPLYVPKDANLLTQQWKEYGGDERLVKRWNGYFDAARAFLAEVADLDGEACGEADERAMLQEHLDLILKMAKKAASILNKDAIRANADLDALFDYACRLQKWVADAKKR